MSFQMESSGRYVGPAGESQNQERGRGQRLPFHMSQQAKLRVSMVMGLGKESRGVQRKASQFLGLKVRQCDR